VSQERHGCVRGHFLQITVKGRFRHAQPREAHPLTKWPSDDPRVSRVEDSEVLPLLINLM
jgi:hypothetical protein